MRTGLAGAGLEVRVVTPAYAQNDAPDGDCAGRRASAAWMLSGVFLPAAYVLRRVRKQAGDEAQHPRNRSNQRVEGASSQSLILRPRGWGRVGRVYDAIRHLLQLFPFAFHRWKNTFRAPNYQKENCGDSEDSSARQPGTVQVVKMSTHIRANKNE